MKSDREYYQDGIVEVRDFSLEKIGGSYNEEEAEPGYSYYRVKIEAANISHFSENENYIWRWYDGENYDDVKMLERDYSTALSYADVPLIPAGRTVILDDILLIREGVGKIRVSYEEGYDGDGKEIWLTVP